MQVIRSIERVPACGGWIYAHSNRYSIGSYRPISVIIDSGSLIYVPTTTERKDLHAASVRNFNCGDAPGKYFHSVWVLIFSLRRYLIPIAKKCAPPSKKARD